MSEFAGAAAQLKNWALLVNPNDIGAVAAAIKRCFMFSRQERQIRMRSMRRSIAKENVAAWAEAFRKAVTRESQVTARAAVCGMPV